MASDLVTECLETALSGGETADIFKLELRQNYVASFKITNLHISDNTMRHFPEM
jgi:hypothetical protein